jgi:hypothetical protein
MFLAVEKEEEEEEETFNAGREIENSFVRMFPGFACSFF